MPAPILEIEALSKRYAQILAVDEVSFTVQEGEFVTLLGASGSGKSTVLTLIGGFADPTSGDIRLRGVSITKMPPRARKIGMVFQNYALFPHLSVFENLAFPLRNARWDKAGIEARVRELLEMTKLVAFATRYPSQLSGGQQQRVAVARALAINPTILLLDEPLGALDKNLRQHMVAELQDLHRRLGTTMIYVTHDQEEALVMSDRIALLDRGKLVAMDTPLALYDDPRTAFVAEFLGHSNIFQQNPAGGGLFVALRPERILLGDIPSGWSHANGQVRETIFLGDRIRYEIDVGRPDPIVVVEPRRFGVPPRTRGEQVTLGWHPGDMRPVAKEGRR